MSNLTTTKDLADRAELACIAAHRAWNLNKTQANLSTWKLRCAEYVQAAARDAAHDC